MKVSLFKFYGSLFFLLPFLLLVTFSQAEAKPTEALPALKAGEYALYSNGAYKVISTFEVEGLKLDSSCQPKAAKKPTCEAFQIGLNGKAKKNQGFNGSPASQFCSDLGGVNLIALNELKQEFNFCEFKDGSLVNSWSLYDKRNPKLIIK